MLAGLSALLQELPQHQALAAKLKAGQAESVSIFHAARALLIGSLWSELRAPLLVVTPHPEDARRLHDQLAAYWGDGIPLLHFAELEALPFERLTPDSAIVHQRVRVLAALAGLYPGQAPPLVVTSASGAALKTLPPALFREQGEAHRIRRGDTIPMQALLARWTALGYRMGHVAEVPGTASRRGGIVDVFPPGEAFPFRLDFWGDFLESIKTYDPGSQRSLAPVDEVVVTPAQELLPALADRAGVEALVQAMNMENCTTKTSERIGEELSLLLSGQEVEDAGFYLGFFNQASLLDYLPEGGLLVLDQPAELEHVFLEMDERAQEMRRAKLERGELPNGFPSPYFTWEEMKPGLTARGRLQLTRWEGDAFTSFPFLQAPSYGSQLDQFLDDAAARQRRGQRIVVVTSHGQRLKELLADHGVGASLSDDLEALPAPGSVNIVRGALNEGWEMTSLPQSLSPEGGEGRGRALPAAPPTSLPQPLFPKGREGSSVPPSLAGKGARGLGEVVGGDALPLPFREGGPRGLGTLLLTDAEVFGTSKITRPKRQYAYHVPSLPAEIAPGSYVVHVDHGVAKFAGAITMADSGQDKEYLVLEYADGDKLYVPVEQAHRVGLYVAPNEAPPSLSRLGTQEWANTKSRVKHAAREMAEELMALYAKRQAVPGIAFGEDTPWQKEVEDAFPYVETPDQMKAILAVKQDMESGQPMDRLVCGDVGYGKTEVALRAAFKAVAYGYQVAVLAPTTILAQQHYVTFTERLQPYPLRVEVLSRFRNPKEQDEVLDGLASGRVDICIGTHRLLQKDVKFKNLGLVIIDEEHRFGVGHKERLKQMRAEVDVLTLSATPIPRTLNMALTGVRDMSAMETPPEERLPIKTYVSEDSDDLIKEAIVREMDRGGQVFFVHNRIHSIYSVTERVARLVPDARIAVGHGRMDEEELAEVMAAFGRGDYDVLVCTTIIESGLDLPNVNTLIIDRADTFGLAQLYQLRGRVGRGRNRAYAYMMAPRGKRITETAQKRLETILAATELGAGFRIAMKDLEIRGAGQILGAQQSGHIESVGFDLYNSLLTQAVEELKEGKVLEELPLEEPEEMVLNLKMTARIPPSYIEDLPTRLSFYTRLNHARTLEQVKEAQDELWDRFGKFPRDVHNLLYTVRVRVLAMQSGVESITKEADTVAVRLKEDVGGAREPLQRHLGERVRVGNRLLHLDTRKLDRPWGQALLDLLEGVVSFRERVQAMVG
ncbi:MAG: transcription-repair coupling factor [Chloroflexi bacterium]|nr:transcription-repair coupling factor [Chloroflexota bacterium]